MSFSADYIWQGIRHERNWRNANLAYDPATGANYPFSDIARRPFQGWGSVTMMFTDLESDYHGLETSFTKRMNKNWQMSGTYTLSALGARIRCRCSPAAATRRADRDQRATCRSRPDRSRR